MRICLHYRYVVHCVLLLGVQGWQQPSGVERRTDGSVQGSTSTRRGWIQQGMAVALTVPVVAFSLAGRADAKDEVFRKNPLTNPFLEQIRIWEQAEADEIKYGGELERGDAGNKGKIDAYPSLLVPILGIAKDLASVEELIDSKTTSAEENWKQARQILAKPEFEKVAFKKIFNNIYYSDPDRANVYLGGGATPKTEQSIAYLLRNEILTTIEDMQAELDYLIKTTNESPEDLKRMIRVAQTAMKRYLEVVPPAELEKADILFQNSSKA